MATATRMEMETVTPKPNDPDLQLVDELLWRMYPHTFAERVGLRSPGGPFVSTRFAAYLGEQIADAVAGGNARLIVNVAPRQGKSEVCSFASPIWFLDNFPEQRVIVASHTADLALDFGRRCRNEFSENQNLLTKLSEDSKAANRWNTPEGGGMKTVGVGGAITGFGGNLIIVDDPHKGWIEAQSPVMRRRAGDWIDGTLMSRLEPNGSIIVVMQRWHRDDITGHLLSKSGERWKIVTLPALAIMNDPMGRQPGDPVCPERFGKSALEARQAELPAPVWDANYQQNPSASNDGRSYYPFNRADHLRSVTLRTDLPLQLAWDFNRTPGVHVEIGQYDRRVDLFTTKAELAAVARDTPKTLPILKDLLLTIGAMDATGQLRHPHIEVFGDRSGLSATSTSSSIADYQLIAQALTQWKCRFRMCVPAANPAIRSRVLSVNDTLKDSSGQSHWQIDPNCKALIRDLEEVRDDEDGIPEKPAGSDLTHPSDADGYRIALQRPIRSVPAGRAEVIFSGAR